MSNYRNFNWVYKLQKWMDSVAGQTFLNYAYSWGASIVILGTLFKLTHLPLANLMLFLGMGTEVLVFFISAFDRPFDKTADGLELSTGKKGTDEKAADEFNIENGENPAEVVSGQGVVGGPQIIIAGGTSGNVNISGQPGETVEPMQPTAGQLSELSNPVWLKQQQQISPEMEEAQNGYVEALNNLTKMLSKVSEQSERLTTDSQEMENLNRTLLAICKIYEMQLKGASAQIGTIDQINEQTRKMASQIEQLNEIYARMIEAMTINMKAATPLQQ
ncbi:MAG: gliding motility protein GldL [Prevotellaceae bacterium]|nr:gliding motility protein GldL [Prevotellaceae bacterium]